MKTITTSDPNPVLIATIELPENCAGFVEVAVIATGAGSMLTGKKAYPFLKEDGQIKEVEAPTELIPDTGGLLSLPATWSVISEGGSLQVWVSGREAITWTCHYKLFLNQ